MASVTEQEGDNPTAGRTTAKSSAASSGEGAVATRRRRSARTDRPAAGSAAEAPERRPQSPFVRLARVHALTSGGDAVVAIALAGSLFFIDPEAARSRVLLYLLLTVAPFVLVGPLIGPALDRARGGRQAMIVVINGLRVFTAGLIAFYLTSLVLFPIVFVHMVLGKSYAVAKASVVPSTVQSDAELVEKNSRLAVLTAVSSVVAAIPAALGQLIGGSRVTTMLAALAYFLAAVAATRLAKSDTSTDGSGSAAVTTGNVFLASSGMAVMRGIVGFMTFLFAFKFGGRADELELAGVGRAVGAAVRASVLGIEGEGRSLWKLGVLGASTAGGSFIGSFLAPRLRERFAEGKLLLGGLSATAIVSLLATWVGGLSGAGVLAFVVGFSAAASKVAFDAIVQRDAGGANHGAAFARFESRFQLAWVIGALVPVIFPIGIRVGAFIMAAAAAFAAASYYFGGRSARAGTVSPMSATALRRRLQKRPPKLTDDDAVEPSPPIDAAVTSSSPSPPIDAAVTSASTSPAIDAAVTSASTSPAIDAAVASASTPPVIDAATPTSVAEGSGGPRRAKGGRVTRRGRGRRAKRMRSGATAADADHDELEVPGWIGSTPPELQSIRPPQKPASTDRPDGTPEMWDDHR